MDTLSRQDFVDQLNTNFNVYFDPETPTGSELIEVSETRKRTQGESFALLFQGPPEPIYDQRIFKIEHPVLGAGNLFLVPVARVDAGIQYEALFNRLVED